ncbi:S41 family peptidase [Myxococcus xanthus]|uniref:S41 family peptidase n=1 Tax=Myxococcus xanthus TaxID=34 RepID=UPI0015757C58|nr:S41 family peptidase [Myxococcus xanthus]
MKDFKSSQENFSTMLVGANRVRVVGQRSAGTNGNITKLVLPDGFRFMYTGMEVLRPDRPTFHGVGIVPDEEIVPTTEDFATGRDATLLKAIDVLQAREQALAGVSASGAFRCGRVQRQDGAPHPVERSSHELTFSCCRCPGCRDVHRLW